MSFPTGPTIFERAPKTSSESTPASTDSTDSSEKAVPVANPYRHILTHQEKKKQRMPKRKADSWPASILTDPDVLSLDDEGRFVLCKVCHVHYAVHGGKKPKPVIMNSGFRTRAWEVHKERTNSHRLHKKQDASQHHHHQLQQARANAQQQRRADDEHKNSDKTPPKETASSQPALARPPLPKSHGNEPTPARFKPSPIVAPMAKPLAANGVDLQQKQSPSPRRRMIRPPPDHAPAPVHTHAQRQWAQANHEQSRRPIVHERGPPPPSPPPAMAGRNTPQLAMSSEQADGLMRWRNMHDDVTRALGSSHKRSAADAYDSGDLTPPSMRMAETEDFSGNNERVAKKLKSLDDEYDAKVMKRQEVYFDRRSDMYKQYWGTLRDVYNSANHGAHAHPHGQGHPNVNNRAHVNHNPNSANRPSGDFRRQEQAAAQTKESIEFTAPDESGSSEEMVKPVVVHDQALINALDRLTGVISKQFSDRYTQETALMLDAMGKLTNAVDDLRMDQGAAMNRLIQLQEQNLQVAQELLRAKLEKQRNMAAHLVSRSGSGGSGGGSGSSGTSGSS